MPNQNAQVTNTNFISRILNSIGGILIGVILFFISFGVLWWNEGKVDFSRIAKTAVEINSATADTANNKKLVSTTGLVEANSVIGDEPYLAIDKYIFLKRKAEMFSWAEQKDSKNNNNTGGSTTTTTTYTYNKEWTDRPDDSSKFNSPADHTNPAKSVEDKEIRADAAHVGVYYFDNNSIQMTGLTPLKLTTANTTLPDKAQLIENNYIYMGTGTFQTPNIGDIRISYSVLPASTKVTIFGKLDEGSIVPYFDKDNNRLYRLFTGSRDEAIAAMHSEYTMQLWIFRGIGFLLMWIGLSMVFAPISVLLDILPIFGTISRTMIGIITFVLSLILSIITIIIGMIFHNIFMLIGVIIVVVGLIVGYLRLKRKNMPAQTQSPSLVEPQPSVQPQTVVPEINPQLAEYIRTSRAQGMTNEQILQALVKAGWPETVVKSSLGIN